MLATNYGINLETECSPLELELIAFRVDPPRSVGGLGRAEHFWNIVRMIWGPQNKIKQFERNPWSERMVEAAVQHQYLGLSGCASSGKTEFGAVWAIVEWLCAPKETLVICTSTSLKESNRRIWGRIKQFWQAAPGLPGKLVDSMYVIRTNDGTGVFSDESGIACVAGEKKDEKECIGKLIGAHPKRMVLIADELPELTESITEAAKSNLSMNPYFKMIALGNHKSIYDAFGVFVRPKKGWGSVTVEDESWESELGYCERFDGMKSPNILEGSDRYAVYNSKNLATHRKAYTETAAEFWRMCRSFPAPIGTENTIYSEADLIAGKAMEFECSWVRTPTRVSSLDPSFTTGGDRCAQHIGNFGECTDGIWRLQLVKTLMLADNVLDKTPRDYQIARKFRDNCLAESVIPKHASLDTSGAGSVLWSILAQEWSNEILMVNFSGSPSDAFVRASDTATAKQQFDRRVSELWWVGREFMRFGQIRGITPDLMRELCARRYDSIKGADGLRVSVEKKVDMKKRLGFSPDLADSFAVLLELCRQRLRFLAGGVASGQNAPALDWQEKVNAANNLYENVDYSEVEQEAFTSVI